MTASERDLFEFIRSHLISTLITILAFFALAGLAVMLFDQQIVGATQWLDENFGFWGLAAALFVGDTFLSPIPPDVLMLIISKGPMQEHWAFYVLCFGAISSLAGINGWLIGRQLGRTRWAQEFHNKYTLQYQQSVQKYGVWAVIIGALTPFPFSFTCWGAGFLKLKFSHLVIGALFRIPRFFIYFLAIHYGIQIFGVFG